MSALLAFEEGSGIFTFVTALLSFISCFLVVGYELYQSIAFVSNKVKLFPRMICWIAFCEAITSFLILIGMIIENDDFCSAQSGLWQFFSRSSWNWTLMLSAQLDSVIVRKAVPMDEWQMHAITWSIALFFEIVPFFARDVLYGSDDGQLEALRGEQGRLSFKYICTGFKGNDVESSSITIAVFTGYLIVIILILALLNYRLYQFLNKSKNEKILNVARMLRRYPISLCLFWLPNVLLASIVNFCETHDSCPSNLSVNNKFIQPWFVLTLGISNIYGLTLSGIYMVSYMRTKKRKESTIDRLGAASSDDKHNFNDSMFRASFMSQHPALTLTALEEVQAHERSGITHSPMTSVSLSSNAIGALGNKNKIGAPIIHHTAPVTKTVGAASTDIIPLEPYTLSEVSLRHESKESTDDQYADNRNMSSDGYNSDKMFNLNPQRSGIIEYDESDEETIVSEASKSTSALGNSTNFKSDLLDKLTEAHDMHSDPNAITSKVSISMGSIKQQSARYSLSDDEEEGVDGGSKAVTKAKR